MFSLFFAFCKDGKALETFIKDAIAHLILCQTKSNPTIGEILVLLPSFLAVAYLMLIDVEAIAKKCTCCQTPLPIPVFLP
jgi:hypothetical protein